MGNSCRYFAYVDSYAHEELSGEILSEFERHLTACPECMSELGMLKKLKSVMNEAFEAPLDQRFNYGVITELMTSNAPPRAKEIRIAIEDIVISLATLLVIVLLAIRLFDKPSVSSVEMAGRLNSIEKSSLEQSSLSNDQVLELVLRSK